MPGTTSAALPSFSHDQHQETDATKRKGGPDFAGAKDDRSGGNNWSCKTCKHPVKSSPPTNQNLAFYRLDALPVAKLTLSEH